MNTSAELQGVKEKQKGLYTRLKSMHIDLQLHWINLTEFLTALSVSPQ